MRARTAGKGLIPSRINTSTVVLFIVLAFWTGVWSGVFKSQLCQPSIEQQQENRAIQRGSSEPSATKFSSSELHTDGNKHQAGVDQNCSPYFVFINWLQWAFDFKITDFLIAIFTVVLAVKTGSLDRATRGLQRVAVRQMSDGRKVADAALISADVARKGLIANHRAWVKVGRPTLNEPLRFRENGLSTSINLRLTNIGNAPALNVAMSIRIGFVNKDGSYIKNFDDYCEGIARMPPAGQFALYPGDEVPEEGHRFSIFAGTDFRNLADYLFEAQGINHVMPLLLGCILYQFPSDGRAYHQTRFMYQFRMNDFSYFNLEPRKIPVAQIILDDAAFGSGLYAD